MKSYDVQIWDIRKREDRRRSRPYRVRWAVGPSEFEDYFRTKALADGFRSKLVRAANKGEAFDTATGLPVSVAQAEQAITWYANARNYVMVKWPHAAPKYRKTIVEALTTVTLVLVRPTSRKPDPELLRRALYLYGLNPGRFAEVVPEAEANALAWLERASVPVAELAQLPLVRTALDACALRLDRRPAAATVLRRKRAIFYNVLSHAVEAGLLDSNPLDKLRWKATRVAETVDRRVVANPAQVRQLLEGVRDFGVRGQRLVAFFGCLYYAGMRPAEAAEIRESDCELPDNGWGAVTLAETNPRSGGLWTDDGSSRQRRGLKHRGEGETRTVPIPPALVELLRQHTREYGVSDDGRIFRGARGGAFPDTEYGKVWRAARESALTPAQAESPLARRPYDLRHAAASLWLNSGMPPTEVARRLGHSVAVLLRVYANCIDGQQDSMNGRIDDALDD